MKNSIFLKIQDLRPLNTCDNDNDFISRIEIIQQVYYVVTIYTWEED